MNMSINAGRKCCDVSKRIVFFNCSMTIVSFSKCPQLIILNDINCKVLFNTIQQRLVMLPVQYTWSFTDVLCLNDVAYHMQMIIRCIIGYY